MTASVSTGRYTVSLHESADGAHYDLFLESSDRLMTWRLDVPPEQNPGQIMRIADHRVRYLDYEGEISEGRGRVTIHSRGRFRLDGARLELEDSRSASVVLELPK